MKNYTLITLLACFFIAGCDEADDRWTVVPVPSDSRAVYDMLLLDTGLGRDALAVVTRRQSTSGVSYGLREVNCHQRTFRYMGYGDSWDEMMASVDDTEPMTPLVNGSISYYVASAACAAR